MAFKLNTEKKETENKTIRFPLPLIKDIEHVLEGTEITFSKFVIQACEYALKEMEPKKSFVKEWFFNLLLDLIYERF